MTFIEGCAVSLTDIAKRTNATVAEVKAEAAALGMFIGVNWAHEPALSSGDAHALVSGAARRDHDHQAAHREWTVALQRWQTDRETVRREAYQQAFNDGRRTGVNSSRASDRGHAAAAVAVADFEAANPEPRFEQEPAARSWLSRLKVGAR